MFETISLSEEIARTRAEVIPPLQRAHAKLQIVAGSMGAKSLSERLHAVMEDLLSDTFRVIVVGRFKTGKSTFLNAFLGATAETSIEGYYGPLPSHRNPATAVLTDIVYAEAPTVSVMNVDGSTEMWTVDRFLKEGKVRAKEQETIQFFAGIRQFTLGYPSPLLKSGVTLSDSPGMSDVSHREEITREAIGRSDVAIVLFRTDQLAGEDERNFLREVEKSGCKTFVVVNMWNEDSPSDEELLDFVWDRLVVGLDPNAPSSRGVFSERGIYFVNALGAAKARSARDQAGVAASGIGAFESALGDFLRRDRAEIHLGKYLNETGRVADSLRNEIRRREAALTMDFTELQRRIESVSDKLKNVGYQRDLLHSVIVTYEARISSATTDAFDELLGTFGDHLAAELKTRPLLELKGLGAAQAVLDDSKKERIGKELTDHIEDILATRLREWTSSNVDGLPAVLRPLLERMGAELSEKLSRMSEELSSLRNEVAPEVSSEFGLRTDLLKMIKDQIEGETRGNFAGGAIFGGALATGLIATIGPQIAYQIGVFILTTIGVALNPFIILAAIVASLIGAGAAFFSGDGIESKIKTRAVQAVMPRLAADFRLKQAIRDGAINAFKGGTEKVIATVDTAIGAEIDSLDEIKKMVTSEHKEKQNHLLAIAALERTYAEAKDEIQDAILGLAQLKRR